MSVIMNGDLIHTIIAMISQTRQAVYGQRNIEESCCGGKAMLHIPRVCVCSLRYSG
jgi:hypothetical protein